MTGLLYNLLFADMIERLPQSDVEYTHEHLRAHINALGNTEQYLRELQSDKELSLNNLSIQDLQTIADKINSIPLLRRDERYNATILQLSIEAEMRKEAPQAVSTYATISHDLNAPFNSCILPAYLSLRHYLDTLTSPTLKEHSREQLEDSLSFLNPSLFAHEKRVLQSLESSIWETPACPEPLRILCEDLDAIVRCNNRLYFQNLPITFRHDCSSNIIIQNGFILYRVLYNLISNAERAMRPEKGGIPPHEGGQISVHTATEKDRLTILVFDNGPGIDSSRVIEKALTLNLVGPEEAHAMNDQEKLGLLFQPHLSLAASEITTQSGRRGQGLGLSICYQKIVEKMGGTIILTSKLAQGAHFTITIPPPNYYLCQ